MLDSEPPSMLRDKLKEIVGDLPPEYEWSYQVYCDENKFEWIKLTRKNKSNWIFMFHEDQHPVN